MIPPLIPLPGEGQSKSKESREDLFSTLFAPSTPRASPTQESFPDFPADIAAAQREQRHARTPSADSEFGSFVSVQPSEDPLISFGEGVPLASFSPLQNLEFYDRYAEDAKAATKKNKSNVLDELLLHEDDPLYFLSSNPQPDTLTVTQSDSASRTPTPVPPVVPTMEALLDLTINDEWNTAEMVDHLAESPTASTSQRSTSLDHAERISRHPSRQANQTTPFHRPSASPPLIRSPSLPPTPSKLSDPEIQHAQSFFTPSALTGSSSFPTKWVSSLLSRQTVTKKPTLSNIFASYEDDFQDPVPSQNLRPRPIPTSVSAENITHGTPFASHMYIPPSGAPGFTGDRLWNTGRFEFDKDTVAKKSVRLVGRKEMTSVVLTVRLADQIRPHFPALSRLPTSWTLLYSLDQHGISLNTLYTRCDPHASSTLLVMRDSNDVMFGIWLGDGIHPTKGAYYGSGESFLWSTGSDDQLRVFKWTGKNDYVALCEPGYLSFGGGDGHYGLYLDDTLMDGSSAPCPTFNNEPLCSAGPRQGDNVTFECVGLEVWGVG